VVAILNELRGEFVSLEAASANFDVFMLCRPVKVHPQMRQWKDFAPS
jgi:hypothetical protein